MDKRNKKPLKQCPKCHAECVAAKKMKDNNSNINIVYAPKDCTIIARDDDELRLRIWSFMRPPRISSPTPIISPCRLEKVRNLLNCTQNLKLTKLDCIGMSGQCACLVDRKIEDLESSKHVPCRKVTRAPPFEHRKRYHPQMNSSNCSRCLTEPKNAGSKQSQIDNDSNSDNS